MYEHGYLILLTLPGLLRYLVPSVHIRAIALPTFRFHDGKRLRKVDPVKVCTAIRADECFEPDKHLPAAWHGDQQSIAVCMQVARAAFGIKPFRDVFSPGLTNQETLVVLTFFCEMVTGERYKPSHLNEIGAFK